MFTNPELVFTFTKIILALTLVLSVVILVLGTIHTKQQRGHGALLLFALCIAGWAGSIFSNLWLNLEVIQQTLYAFSILAAASCALFVFTFQEDVSPRLKTLILLPAALLALLSFVPGMIFKSFLIHPEGYSETLGGPGYYIYHVLFFAYFTIAAFKTYSRLSLTRNAILRQQLYFLCVGIIIFTLIKLGTTIILGGFLGINNFLGIAPLFALMPLAIAYGIMRQYYYIDLKYILFSAIGEISLFLFAGILYLTSLVTIGRLAPGHNILTYHIAFICTLIGSLRLSPILGKAAIRLAAGPTEAANKAAVEHFTLDLFEQQHTPLEIANLTTALCGNVLSAEKCILIIQSTNIENERSLLAKIKENNDHLLEEPTILLLEATSQTEIGVPSPKEKFGEALKNIYDATLVATLASQRVLYGLLILGPRKDGRGYSRQDVALLQSMLIPLSSALAEATFRTQIAQLTRSSDNETGKLREQVFEKNAIGLHIIETLENTAREELHQLRSKIESIRKFGTSAIDAAETALERAELIIAHGIRDLRSEALKPVTEYTDLAPLFHKLIEVYGAQSLLRQSHLSYELPEIIPTVCDPQQIYEAIALLFKDIFSPNCSNEAHITFNTKLSTNTVTINITQEFRSMQKDEATKNAPEEKCLRAHENSLAEALIHKNGGTYIGEHSSSSAHITITLPSATNEDRGGIN